VGVTRGCPKFLSNPTISGTGKAADFKFGRLIRNVHPNKSAFNIVEKRECGHIEGLFKII